MDPDEKCHKLDEVFLSLHQAKKTQNNSDMFCFSHSLTQQSNGCEGNLFSPCLKKVLESLHGFVVMGILFVPISDPSN